MVPTTIQSSKYCGLRRKMSFFGPRDIHIAVRPRMSFAVSWSVKSFCRHLSSFYAWISADHPWIFIDRPWIFTDHGCPDGELSLALNCYPENMISTGVLESELFRMSYSDEQTQNHAGMITLSCILVCLDEFTEIKKNSCKLRRFLILCNCELRRMSGCFLLSRILLRFFFPVFAKFCPQQPQAITVLLKIKELEPR